MKIKQAPCVNFNDALSASILIPHFEKSRICKLSSLNHKKWRFRCINNRHRHRRCFHYCLTYRHRRLTWTTHRGDGDNGEHLHIAFPLLYLSPRVLEAVMPLLCIRILFSFTSSYIYNIILYMSCRTIVECILFTDNS
jgi:hypothetical protein